jgi:O-antigen/teichoic acid export membrane protein
VGPSGSRRLIGAGALLAAAVALANGLNAVFQFALARILDPAEFSLQAALFTIAYVASIPPLAFQATVAREVAQRLAGGDRAAAGAVFRETLRAVLLWTGALLLLGIGALAVLAVAVDPDAGLAVAATAATVAFTLAVPVLWGGLQGAGRFRELAGAHILFAGSRLGVGVAVALAGGGAGEVMLGVAAATACTAVLSFLPLRSLVEAARAVPALVRGLVTRANVGAAVGLTTLVALTSTDLLVAKLSFDADTAADYAAASIGARVLLLVPIGVTTVLFPRVATLGDARRERRHLLAGLVAVGAASAVLVAVLWALAGPLLELTFGSGYDEAAAWLGPLSLAMALYALATVYLYHFLSLGRIGFAAVLLALLACQAVLFTLLHQDPADLIGVQIAVAAATLVAAELWHLLRHRRPLQEWSR